MCRERAWWFLICLWSDSSDIFVNHPQRLSPKWLSFSEKLLEFYEEALRIGGKIMELVLRGLKKKSPSSVSSSVKRVSIYLPFSLHKIVCEGQRRLCQWKQFEDCKMQKEYNMYFLPLLIHLILSPSYNKTFLSLPSALELPFIYPSIFLITEREKTFAVCFVCTLSP